MATDPSIPAGHEEAHSVVVPPSALDHLDDIARNCDRRRLFVFLDFDGTLTPIVDRAEASNLSDSMRVALVELKERLPVAVISGRDLADIARRVAVDGVQYAGSHGFDIASPDGGRHAPTEAIAKLPALDAAEQELRATLSAIDGIRVERKRFSVTVHYRLVRDEDIAQVKAGVKRIGVRHPNLRLAAGKKVFELLPDVGWNKGRAVQWLIDALGLKRSDILPVYIGDDLTDEDAFRVLEGDGIGICVLTAPRETKARYSLRDPTEVEALLRLLAARASNGRRYP